jgi:Protein of unknown function (DUF3150)
MDTRKFTEHAAGALMVLSVTARRYEGRIKLIEAGHGAASAAGANPATASLYVGLLGSNQKKLTELSAACKSVYRYMEDRFLPAGERGAYLVPVIRIPQVLAELEAIRTKAHAMRDSFIPEYDRLLNLAKAQDFGDWRKEAARKAPEAEELRTRFAVVIGVPKPLAVFSPERLATMALPMHIAQQIADASTAELAERLEAARKVAIESARDQLAVVIKQLASGERLHDSLITNTRRAAAMLKDFAESYDRDIQITALADQMAEAVNVPSTEIWKASPKVREKSAALASKAHNSLQAISMVERPVVIPPSVVDKSPATKPKMIGNGLLAKKAAKAKK